jgi:hypothetical protein
MAHDALDPGADGTYPYFPRDANGAPLWSDEPETDGTGVIVNGVLRVRMPRGTRHTLRGGQRLVVDMTPRQTDGSPPTPLILAPSIASSPPAMPRASVGVRLPG